MKIPCDKRREAASSQAPYGACDDAAESLEGETSERLYKGEEEKTETGAHCENAYVWRAGGIAGGVLF